MNNIDIPIQYHSKQDKLFFKSKAKVKVVAKGRRFGLTHGYSNFVIENMMDGVTPILWVDTVNGNIDRYMERYFYPTLRNIPIQYWKWRQQKKELSLFDSRCDFRSEDQPERIEGFAYRLIVLNEAGIILKNEYLWENTIRPMTMDYNPDLLIGGTPKGQNLFHDLKVKAQDDKDPRYKDWEFFHFTSYDNPYIMSDVIKQLEDDMPEHVKKQEIFAQFLEDSAAVFQNIDRCIGSEREKPIAGKTYYAGLDLAKHVDFTVLTILDEEGKQVYFTRLNKLDYPYQKKLIIDTINQYDAYLLVDATGVGSPILDDLANEGLNVEGYEFTNKSKKELIECLLISFTQERIKILDEPIQTNELRIFGYEISPSRLMRYTAPEGKHDDTVIALALANWCRENYQGNAGEILVL